MNVIDTVEKITFLMYLIINLQKKLIDWDLARRMEWQWQLFYGRRRRAFRNDFSGNNSPIPIGPTPPPSPPPTPPHTPPRSDSSYTLHPIYNQLFNAKDVVVSFENLINEYQKLIDIDGEQWPIRNKRSSAQHPDTSEFAWRCVRNLNNEDSSSEQYKGVKFLTWGGRVKEEHVDDPENRLP